MVVSFLLGSHHFWVIRSLLGERGESVVSSYAERSSEDPKGVLGGGDYAPADTDTNNLPKM
jgi:hypothetical protein